MPLASESLMPRLGQVPGVRARASQWAPAKRQAAVHATAVPHPPSPYYFYCHCYYSGPSTSTATVRQSVILLLAIPAGAKGKGHTGGAAPRPARGEGDALFPALGSQTTVYTSSGRKTSR